MLEKSVSGVTNVHIYDS